MCSLWQVHAPRYPSRASRPSARSHRSFSRIDEAVDLLSTPRYQMLLYFICFLLSSYTIIVSFLYCYLRQCFYFSPPLFLTLNLFLLPGLAVYSHRNFMACCTSSHSLSTSIGPPHIILSSVNKVIHCPLPMHQAQPLSPLGLFLICLTCCISHADEAIMEQVKQFEAAGRQNRP